ncbi:MAG: hypothetical protein MH204_01250 [Fimbriimonadaceae bacterium]|nr:hypothetical protein [Fimbriimonadaceae bacterium]
MTRKGWAWFCLCTGTVALIACGGGAGGGAGRACGNDFLTPNYLSENDPADGDPNRVLFWPGFPIRYVIQNAPEWNFGSGTVFGTSLTTASMNRWQTATDGGVDWQAVASESQAELVVRFNQVASEPGAGGTLGSTTLSFFVDTGEIVSASVTINHWPGMTEAQVRDGLMSTISHELGHALFISGHSTDEADLMYWRAPTDRDKAITTRDNNSIRSAYCNDFRNRGRSLPDSRRPIRTITVACPPKH